LIVLAVFVLLSALGVQSTRGTGTPDFGDPLPGADLGVFETGKEDFEEVEEVEDGLGPIFNARGCAECHTTPAVGGGSAIAETRFQNSFRHGDLPGGSLLQLFAIDPDCQEVIPGNANSIARRLTTPLFGAGLIEAIPDRTIIEQAERQARVRDGVTGRPNIVLDVATNQRRVGRFGWKAQQATLTAFSADAYLNEMGITNPLFPDENAPNGDQQRLAECDTIPDPEDDGEGVENFTNFMQLLAPPPRGQITGQVLRGERVFLEIGCATCHVPVMATGFSSNPLFDRKPVRLFSDLLLHDVGTGDGIRQAGAEANELRTPPLWGLRVRRPLLHDGRADTIETAIRLHGGEASGAAGRFRRLSRSDRNDLLAFLNSL
jgi:CxxC motif-containing protein (DUF1111 family)